MVQEVSSEKLQQLISSIQDQNQTIVILFYDNALSSDRTFNKRFDELAQEFTNMTFVKINVGEVIKKVGGISLAYGTWKLKRFPTVECHLMVMEDKYEVKKMIELAMDNLRIPIYSDTYELPKENINGSNFFFTAESWYSSDRSEATRLSIRVVSGLGRRNLDNSNFDKLLNLVNNFPENLFF